MQTSGRATRRTIPNVSGPMLRIAHLYADEMNIYGDRGNILTLQKRAEWRGIPVEVRAIGRGPAPDLSDIDLIFWGGGQDRDQELVFTDAAAPKVEAIRQATAGGAVGLAGGVCGPCLHGSLLPKNPHFADFLLRRALQRRGPVRFAPLDDTMEMAAHNSIRERIGAGR